MSDKLTSKKLQQLSSSLKSIDCSWYSNYEQFEQFFCEEFQWASHTLPKLDINELEKKHLAVLGTIGGGNHFAEFQEISKIVDE